MKVIITVIAALGIALSGCQSQKWSNSRKVEIKPLRGEIITVENAYIGDSINQKPKIITSWAELKKGD